MLKIQHLTNSNSTTIPVLLAIHSPFPLVGCWPWMLSFCLFWTSNSSNVAMLSNRVDRSSIALPVDAMLEVKKYPHKNRSVIIRVPTTSHPWYVLTVLHLNMPRSI